MGFVEQRQIDPKTAIGGLAAGDRLEHKVDRRAARDDFKRIGDMGEHAGLGRNGVARADFVQHVDQSRGVADIVGSRIDADHRIARAMGEPVEHGRGYAPGVVGGVVGLQPGRQPAAQPDRIAERGDNMAFARDGDQVLVAHQLGNGGGHFGRQARRKRREGGVIDLMGQEMVAKRAHRHRGNR